METLVGVFTVSVQEDRILIPSHALINGDTVKFKLDDPTSCALPFPLNDIDLYHVVGARGNDFQVSDTPAGPLINLTDKGTGSNEVWKQVPDEPGSNMIRYTGEGDLSKVNIRLFGNGVTKSVAIDLSKAPFKMTFSGYTPINAVVQNISVGMAKSISISGDILTVRFETPPPKVEVGPIMTQAPQNVLSFQVYFLYGSATEVIEEADARNNDS
jgi:hypothetical protein